MSVVFIGSVYPESIYKHLLEYDLHVDFAANTFQRNLLTGLSQHYENITVITSPIIPSYPKLKKIILRKFKSIELFGKTLDTIFIGCINIPLIKMVSEYFRVKEELNLVLEDDNIVYIYALHSPFLYAVYNRRRSIGKVCVIVPDLPEYMSHNRGFIRKFLKKLNRSIIDKCLSRFDYYVLLSSYMKEFLPIEDKNCLQIEGIYSGSRNQIPILNNRNKKTLLYAGMISSEYGIFDMIESFLRIKGDDYQLWLCGSCLGEVEKFNSLISKDNRIKYFGILKHENVEKLLRYATLLINPRHSYKDFTKYSFPSKTMEYMASGIPVLMCRLPSIPDEYNDFLFFFDDESIDGMTAKMIEVSNMDKIKMREHGLRSQNFIFGKKNCIIQTKKIINMVDNTSVNLFSKQ